MLPLSRWLAWLTCCSSTYSLWPAASASSNSTKRNHPIPSHPIPFHGMPCHCIHLIWWPILQILIPPPICLLAAYANCSIVGVSFGLSLPSDVADRLVGIVDISSALRSGWVSGGLPLAFGSCHLVLATCHLVTLGIVRRLWQHRKSEPAIGGHLYGSPATLSCMSFWPDLWFLARVRGLQDTLFGLQPQLLGWRRPHF